MFLHFTLGILYLKVVSALLVEVRRIAVRRGAPGQGGGGVSIIAAPLWRAPFGAPPSYPHFEFGVGVVGAGPREMSSMRRGGLWYLQWGGGEGAPTPRTPPQVGHGLWHGWTPPGLWHGLL